MYSDARQPRGKLCPPGKLGKMLVRAHVSVLHHVLSFAIVAQNGPCYAVKELVVTAHDDFEHGRLAREDADHNFLVTQGLLRSCRIPWADHADLQCIESRRQ